MKQRGGILMYALLTMVGNYNPCFFYTFFVIALAVLS